MSKKQQHVVPHGDQWAVKGAVNSKATKITDTQKEAIEVAKEISKNQQAELKIHGTDGKIRDSISYGNDPFPPTN